MHCRDDYIMKKTLGLFSYLKGVSVNIVIISLCLICTGYAAERDFTLQWDESIDAPYLQSYKIYYYTTLGDTGSLNPVDNAVSCSTPLFPAAPCTPNGPITIDTKDKNNTKITLGLKVPPVSDPTKSYYFVVTAVDQRGLESIPTLEITFQERNLLTGLNVLSLSPEATGWIKAENVAAAVGADCLSVTKFDATAQGFVAHIKGTPLNDFDVVTGNAYFVNVKSEVPFIIGEPTAVFSIPYTLKTGLNLVKMPDDKVAITKAEALATNVGTTCLSIIKWDASKQGFVAHIKGTPLNNFDVAAGEGYFINVNAITQWQ